MVVHCARRPGEFHRESQHGHPLGRQVRCGPVLFNGSRQLIVAEQPTQTAPVVDDSVMAVVLEAHHQSDDLPLDLAERRRTRHGRLVQTLVGRHAARVQRMHRQDVVDPAISRIDDPRIQLTEFAVPSVVGNDLDARHSSAFHDSRAPGQPGSGGYSTFPLGLHNEAILIGKGSEAVGLNLWRSRRSPRRSIAHRLLDGFALCCRTDTTWAVSGANSHKKDRGGVLVIGG